jgi:hypothetical protein
MDQEKKIIGVSSQSPKEREITSKILNRLSGYEIGDFDVPIYSTLIGAIGFFIHKDDEKMDAYLGQEWSYVIQQKFMEGGKMIFKPIRYYLTPRQIFTKLKYNIREIHSNYWVNAYFNSDDYICTNEIILPVRYPNEADAIIDRGGIIIRINNDLYKPTKEEVLMDGYSFNYKLKVDGETDIEEKLKHLWNQIKNQ